MDGALFGGFDLFVVRNDERTEFGDLPRREVAAHFGAGGLACSQPKMHHSLYW
jgi:hypothetical protein